MLMLDGLTFSDIFSMMHGVRQGAVLSAIFYCIYMNDLFQILRRSKFGCWVNGDFFGILGYSDDNFILAPSLHALQQMPRVMILSSALILTQENARQSA